MLLSFNKCPISAVAAPIYQLVNVLEETTRTSDRVALCVTRSLIGLYVYNTVVILSSG